MEIWVRVDLSVAGLAAVALIHIGPIEVEYAR